MKRTLGVLVSVESYKSRLGKTMTMFVVQIGDNGPALFKPIDILLKKFAQNKLIEGIKQKDKVISNRQEIRSRIPVDEVDIICAKYASEIAHIGVRCFD
jgi:hypothetical protein